MVALLSAALGGCLLSPGTMIRLGARGKVVDAESHQPIKDASVTYNAIYGNSINIHSKTDADGEFNIKAPILKSTYIPLPQPFTMDRIRMVVTVTVTATGHTPEIRTLNRTSVIPIIDSGFSDLGVIELRPEAGADVSGAK